MADEPKEQVAIEATEQVEVAPENIEVTPGKNDVAAEPSLDVKRTATEEEITTPAEEPPKKKRRRNYDEADAEKEPSKKEEDEEGEDGSEDEVDYENVEDDDEEEDDLEIDETNIITSGRRTRGKVIDFKEAAKKLDADTQRNGTTIVEEFVEQEEEFEVGDDY